MKTKYTKQDHVEWLNELPVPSDDLKSNGGRIPDEVEWEHKYGDWMRRSDPIAFNVSYQEKARL